MAFDGIWENENVPSISETTPCIVPFTTIDTPGRGAPEESLTFPETNFCGCTLRIISLELMGERMIWRPITSYLIPASSAMASRISVIF